MSARRVRQRLLRRAKSAGLELSDVLAGGLETYYLELARWNAKVNLTAFALEDGGTDAAVDRLLIEPVLAAKHVDPNATSLLDAGSGGGSPAIPLKLARPDLALYMVEAKVRKSAFLRQVSRLLELHDAHVLTSRFEELLTRADLHEAMSAVSIRAVRMDSKVLTTLQAFLKPGGEILCFTSDQVLPAVVLPMRTVGVYDLLPVNRSRLVVLHKKAIGSRST